MVTELLVGCLVGGLAGAFLRRQEVRAEGDREEERTRELAVELALHVAERTPVEGELRIPRRMVERILLLGRRIDADPSEIRAAALAAALPAGASADSRLPLPDGTRAALANRHARHDGLGLPPGIAGSKIPVPARLLAAADWLESRDGASEEALAAALADEAGRRFDPAMVKQMLAVLSALLAAGPADGHLGMRVTHGALLCVAAANPDAVPLHMRGAFLAALETRVRERLRPTDRVYCTDAEVVVWLSGASADGAIAVVRRLEPIVARVAVPSIQRLEVACRIGLAAADTDATSFSELVQTARARALGSARMAG
jgi:hypothetical protein